MTSHHCEHIKLLFRLHTLCDDVHAYLACKRDDTL